MLREAIGHLVDLPQNLQSIARIEQHLRAIGGTLGTAGEDIHELRASSRRQEARVERVEGAVTELNGRLTTIEVLVSGLARAVGDATERLPDKEKGPFGKARDALSGDSRR
jgi:DNA anti-recombination protein RmuC